MRASSLAPPPLLLLPVPPCSCLSEEHSQLLHLAPSSSSATAKGRSRSGAKRSSRPGGLSGTCRRLCSGRALFFPCSLRGSLLHEELPQHLSICWGWGWGVGSQEKGGEPSRKGGGSSPFGSKPLAFTEAPLTSACGLLGSVPSLRGGGLNPSSASIDLLWSRLHPSSARGRDRDRDTERKQVREGARGPMVSSLA